MYVFIHMPYDSCSTTYSLQRKKSVRSFLFKVLCLYPWSLFLRQYQDLVSNRKSIFSARCGEFLEIFFKDVLRKSFSTQSIRKAFYVIPSIVVALAFGSIGLFRCDFILITGALVTVGIANGVGKGPKNLGRLFLIFFSVSISCPLEKIQKSSDSLLQALT